MDLDQLRTVQDRLGQAGFGDPLTADGSMLRASATGSTFDPGELAVVEMVEFEDANDPADETILFAVATAAGEPVGTYTVVGGPAASSEDAAIVERLQEPPVDLAAIEAHRQHDHIASVFASSEAAQAAVEELRELGLGSAELGVAVQGTDQVVFERDAEDDMRQDTKKGVGTGMVTGFLAGFALIGLGIPGIGILGVGGLLALGTAGVVGGGVLGGYLGVAAGTRALSVHDQLRTSDLAPGEVLVAVCSHGQGEVIEQTMTKHGGRMIHAPHE